MCHWIVSGLRLLPSDEAASDSDSYRLATEERSSGLTELMSYVPPTPPPKTGYHRYVFVLLAPKDSKGSGEELEKPKDRPHWGYGEKGAGVMEWAEDNGLVAVGESCFGLLHSCAIGSKWSVWWTVWLNKDVGANFFYAQNKKQ